MKAQTLAGLSICLFVAAVAYTFATTKPVAQTNPSCIGYFINNETLFCVTPDHKLVALTEVK